MLLLVALAWHTVKRFASTVTLFVPLLAFTRLVKAARGWAAFPLHPAGTTVVSCPPKIKPPPLVRTAL